jgi:hypothetical protein
VLRVCWCHQTNKLTGGSREKGQVHSASTKLVVFAPFDEAEDAFHGSLQNPAMQQDAMFSTKLIFYKQQLQQLLLGWRVHMSHQLHSHTPDHTVASFFLWISNLKAVILTLHELPLPPSCRPCSWLSSSSWTDWCCCCAVPSFYSRNVFHFSIATSKERLLSWTGNKPFYMYKYVQLLDCPNTFLCCPNISNCQMGQDKTPVVEGTITNTNGDTRLLKLCSCKHPWLHVMLQWQRSTSTLMKQAT